MQKSRNYTEEECIFKLKREIKNCDRSLKSIEFRKHAIIGIRKLGMIDFLTKKLGYNVVKSIY